MTVVPIIGRSNLADRLRQAGAPVSMSDQQGYMIVPFGEWLPDLNSLRAPGATEVINAIPVGDGYNPFPNAVGYSSNALGARCQGAAVAHDTGGNQRIYAGDASNLYRMADTSFVENSSSTGAYNCAVDDYWEFAQFGDRLLAANIGDQVQSISIGAATTWANHITSTNTPRARHIGVIRNQVVLGNTNDATDGPQPWRVWWSGIGDSRDFDPAAATQSDYQDLEDGGWVQAVVGGAEYGLIFQEKRIVRMTYVGSPLVYAFDPVDRSRGTPIPGSVIGWGRNAFFISEEGFYATDGQESYPIGHNKVDRTFWDQFDMTYFGRVSAAIDPINKLVLWNFPGTGATAGAPNRIFFYNWADRRWGQVQASVSLIVQLASQGYTLDGLDAVSTDIDALTPTLDSRQWTGNVIRMGVFTTANQLGFLTGTSLACRLETTEAADIGGRRLMVRSVRPLVDGGNSLACSMGVRERQNDNVSFGSTLKINADGYCAVRAEGRYHRVRLSISASTSWSHAVGVEVVYSKTGRR